MADNLDGAAKTLQTGVVREPRPRLNMIATTVTQAVCHDKPVCETMACVAGFYYLGKMQDLKFRTDHPSVKTLLDDHGKTATFTDGANLMAKDVGFLDTHEFRHWAEQNPEIWGNKKGVKMLVCETAYGLKPDDPISIHHVVTHLHAVASRMRHPEQRITNPT